MSLRGVFIAALALWASSWVDGPFAEFVAVHPFEGSFELLALARSAGYLPLWVVVAAAMVMIDWPLGWRGIWRRGGWLVTATVLSGAGSEILKILVRRERPLPPFVDYVFRPWSEQPWSSGGLGWPSSHASVAFAAVWVLWRLYPRGWPVWLLVAGGCSWSRLVFNDHYFSDIVGSAVLSWCVVSGLSAVTGRWGSTAYREPSATRVR